MKPNIKRNFKLVRHSNSSSTVKRPDYSKVKEALINTDQINKTNFANEINSFINTLKESIPNADLSILYHNLENIKIKIKPLNIRNLFVSDKIRGKYIMLFNKIILYSKDINTLNHELLHFSSTIINDDYVYCGFSVKKYGTNRTFGISLMEGYTQLLNIRYFNDQRRNKSYSFEKLICSFLEEIVGQNIMETLYFKASLFDLITELEKYNSTESIMLFINNFDFVSNHFYEKGDDEETDNILANKLKEISYFLYITYYKMLLIHQTPNIETKITAYARSLMINVRNDKREYTLLSSDDYNSGVLDLAVVGNFAGMAKQ
jgi:hypothetical protein